MNDASVLLIWSHYSNVLLGESILKFSFEMLTSVLKLILSMFDCQVFSLKYVLAYVSFVTKANDTHMQLSAYAICCKPTNCSHECPM